MVTCKDCISFDKYDGCLNRNAPYIWTAIGPDDPACLFLGERRTKMIIIDLFDILTFSVLIILLVILIIQYIIFKIK